MQKPFIIIVPVYKDFTDLNELQRISVNQLFQILGKYPICLVGPSNFNWDPYLKNAQDNNIYPTIREFDSNYFASIKEYNKLLISLVFFKEFEEYGYMLLYQLDAYVFRDELLLWCNKGYDYVGAPWNGIHSYMGVPMVGVGNGGFSLRNIKSSIKLLEKIRIQEFLQQYRGYNWKGLVPKLPSIIKRLEQTKKKPSKCEENYHFQEDYFWCNVAPAALSSFSCRSVLLKLLCWLYTRNHYKIAPKNIAVSFSLETNARELFMKNNNTLPFGCHAWEKYEPDFWKEFIPMTELVK